MPKFTLQTYNEYIKRASICGKNISQNEKYMYYFNYNLIKELPNLFGMPKYLLCQQAGVGVHAIDRWSSSASMSVGKFVDFLNTLHLSMADFLVTSPSPTLKKRKEDYIVPAGIWTPLEWNFTRIAKTYGAGSVTGMESAEALVKSLGMSTRSVAAAWATDPYAMKMCTLIDLLNRFKLDARDFIVDRNRDIELPEWKEDRNSGGNAAYILGKDLKELDSLRAQVDTLKKQIKDRDSLVASMTLEMDRLKKENEAFRSGKNVAGKVREGLAAESPVVYGNPFGRKRLVFHRALWESLPELFGMTFAEFRQEFNVSSQSFYSGSVKMDTLIGVCNGLHISISHFFPPEGEPLTVNHRGWYEISRNVFKPIESRMENLKFIFRRDTFGFTLDQLKNQTGLSNAGVDSLTTHKGKSSMVLTVLDICNSFSLPIYTFVYDPNDRRRPEYSTSQNETLIENCVKLAKAYKMSQEEIKRLKNRLKEEQ